MSLDEDGRRRPGPVGQSDLVSVHDVSEVLRAIRSLERVGCLSETYGYDRGNPLDRLAIDAFLQRNAQCIRGNVLEVGDRRYTVRFGGTAVTRSDIVDRAEWDGAVDILGDICDPQTLRGRQYDCIIAAQVLQYLSDLASGALNLVAALAPRGTLLLTAPCIGRLDPGDGRPDDLWRFTPQALTKIFGCTPFDTAISTFGYGGLGFAAAFLCGASIEDLPELRAQDDSDFPVVACMKLVRLV